MHGHSDPSRYIFKIVENVPHLFGYPYYQITHSIPVLTLVNFIPMITSLLLISQSYLPIGTKGNLVLQPI